MEQNFEVSNFSQDDVISFHAGIYKADQVIEQLQDVLIHDISPELAGRFNKKMGAIIIPLFSVFSQGIDCEMLKVGSQGWTKGKIKIKVTLEFCPAPDESKSISSESLIKELRESIHLQGDKDSNSK